MNDLRTAALEVERLQAARERDNVSFKQLLAQRDELLLALNKIAAIENQMFGPDWEEIDEAREIARVAIAKAQQ